MKKFLCLLTMLISLQVFAGTTEIGAQDNDSVRKKIKKGEIFLEKYVNKLDI